MEKLPNIHPGEILLEEFLVPLSVTPYRLAKETNIPQTRISEIIKGNRRITKFWLGLQDDFDIEFAINEKHEEFDNIKQLKSA